MDSKEQLIKEIQDYVLTFNEYWESPITTSELVKNTIDTAENIKNYCQMLESYYKKNKIKTYDYNEYPAVIRETISEIVTLVNDGRDLWHKVTYDMHNVFGSDNECEPRQYDHHVENNGHIRFENNPFNWISGEFGIIKKCEDLITLLTSEGKMNQEADFSEITNSGLYYDFTGYESGSMSVRFDRIYIKDKKILIDARIIYYTTYDSHTVDFPGIVTMIVEDYEITNLPYCDYDDFNDEDGDFSAKELFEFIKSHETRTLEQEIEVAQEAIANYIQYED